MASTYKIKSHLVVKKKKCKARLHAADGSYKTSRLVADV